jgi:Tfp pilus assembly protein PilP
MVFSISLVSVSVAADNAFGSLITEIKDSSAMNAPSAETIDKTLHPLLQSAVSSNTLMAIMISPSIKIALIRAQNGEEYFIRVGDLLGNSEGTITDINSIGIEVTEEDEVISLLVRNRSVANENAE